MCPDGACVPSTGDGTSAHCGGCNACPTGANCCNNGVCACAASRPEALQQPVRRHDGEQHPLRRLQPGLQRHLHERVVRGDDRRGRHDRRRRQHRHGGPPARGGTAARPAAARHAPAPRGTAGARRHGTGGAGRGGTTGSGGSRRRYWNSPASCPSYTRNGCPWTGIDSTVAGSTTVNMPARRTSPAKTDSFATPTASSGTVHQALRVGRAARLQHRRDPTARRPVRVQAGDDGRSAAARRSPCRGDDRHRDQLRQDGRLGAAHPDPGTEGG